MKSTDSKLQTLQDKDFILKLENILRDGFSSNMGDRSVKSDENKEILYLDSTEVYGPSMSQPLSYDENEMWHGHPGLYKKKLEEILNTSDGSDIGYLLELISDILIIGKKKESNFHLS